MLRLVLKRHICLRSTRLYTIHHHRTLVNHHVRLVGVRAVPLRRSRKAAAGREFRQ
jgi:hypothetical protein